MIGYLASVIEAHGLEAVDKISNRIGLGAALAPVATKVAEEVEVIEETFGFALNDWSSVALFISACGGVLFIIEKIFVIYLRWKESKRDEK